MKLNNYILATMTREELLETLETSRKGLLLDEVPTRQEKYGRNEIKYKKEKSVLQIILESFLSPFTLVLIVLACIAFTTEYLFVAKESKDLTSAVIIVSLVLVSATLEIVQKLKTKRSIENLDQMVEVTSSIIREGRAEEIPTEEIVLGDIIHLSAGDMLPADVRILDSKDLFISQTPLTGESILVEKSANGKIKKGQADTEFQNMAYMGTEVVSGTGLGVVVRLANETLFGEIAKKLHSSPIKTNFEKGIESTSHLLIKLMVVIAPLVILMNGFSTGSWIQALLFGISVAVGLTPEMLPVIVNSNLIRGAKRLSDKGTIVKDMNAIQNFGAIDILCTDKTGTLTRDNISLEYYLNSSGEEDFEVLKFAYFNSSLQTGLKNVIDRAIIRRGRKELPIHDLVAKKIDEIPFDFERRRLSVLVQKGHRQLLITKGAIEEMLHVTNKILIKGQTQELNEDQRIKALDYVQSLNKKGLRVLGLSLKEIVLSHDEISVKDESDMTLIGYLAFLDPPKEGAKEAIEALAREKVQVKVLTGDNQYVTQAVCRQVGIDADDFLTGDQVEFMNDNELKRASNEYNIFVKLNPTQKARLVKLMREAGHAVGFLGDGINDSPAMREADVGISVDNAVDIAKESADLILLEKDLGILEKGVINGREIFGNIMKYITITVSSNFGNIFSVLLASIFLPFLPMQPMQLLFLNLIYDISCLSIPFDKMDPKYLRNPQKLNSDEVRRFMLWFGPISSIFDILTFFALYIIIIPKFLGSGYRSLTGDEQLIFISIFHTGWYLVSLWTQTLVLYTLRTKKIPFLQSKPSLPMFLVTGCTVAVGTIIPYTKLGVALDFISMPVDFWFYLLTVVFLYLSITTIVKNIYIRKYGKLL
ncbi:MAG: magnesium-translocating P-type ATPase [Planctomycetes bacterium]|nr:magnesium-translocating P-type ATPase [Planctomycetota bacterium]HPY75052.1 magnesium-translocating P-type ATPase [Planctomycetota bacterium]HQB00713.1 magnesium-translocating P-type ATPase [Planctomycetota bacterium]